MAKTTLGDRVSRLEKEQKHCRETMTEELKDMKDWMGNGFTGDVARVAVREIDKRLKPLNDDVHYIKGKIDGLAGAPSGKKILFRRILETVVYAVVGIGAVGLIAMFFLGRLTTDDVAELLRAWHGG